MTDSRPPVIQYYVTHNFYEPVSVTVTVNPSTNLLLFTDVQEGRWYTFSVIAKNVLGNGSEAVIRFCKSHPLIHDISYTVTVYQIFIC